MRLARPCDLLLAEGIHAAEPALERLIELDWPPGFLERRQSGFDSFPSGGKLRN
ncbi:MAG: hypothetical protein ACP5P4_13280 [Steroidobacteraceae bacterium]